MAKKFKIKKGDRVVAIAGKDKGKSNRFAQKSFFLKIPPC